MYLPIIGSFLEATGVIIEKKILRLRSINYKNYVLYSFLAIILIMIPFVYFVWELNSEALKLNNILIMGVVVLCSILANLFIFYSLKRENVTESEPAWMMQPLFTIFLAFILYSNERNWTLVAPALVASISLVLSHIKKHHLSMNKYILAAIAGSFLFAAELAISKFILKFYSPFSFYFVRSFFVFIFVAIIYRKEFRLRVKGKSKVLLSIFAVAAMWVAYRAIIYYAYENVGIVFTTTLFILSYVFMFLMAVLFLKEKPSWRNIISTLIILVCVAFAIIIS